MVSPFLLRAVLDTAIPDANTGLLVALVVGMIAIAVANRGPRRRPDAALQHGRPAGHARPADRRSTATFSASRSPSSPAPAPARSSRGSRTTSAGVQSVVTSTATSIVSNVTTVLAAGVAMFLLDWRLALFALGLLPFFVWLTRRVGAERRRITAERQGQLADISALIEESLSVSGILLGKTMGRSGELAERFERESAELADLEVRSRMAGRWRMASVQIAFAAMPALVYLFAGLSIAERRARDHDRHPGRLHDPADQDLLPDPVAALGQRRRAELAGAVRACLRLSRRAGRDPRAPGRAARSLPSEVRGEVELRRGRLSLRARRRLDASRRRSDDPRRDHARAGRRDGRRQDDARLPARAPLRPAGGRGDDRRHRRARAVAPEPRRNRRRGLTGDLPVPRLGAREPALRAARRRPTPRSRPRRGPPRSTT